MLQKPGIQKRRALSPEKLRRARLNAGYDNISETCRKIGILRRAYMRWEKKFDSRGQLLPPITHWDFLAFANALALFGVEYESVTDELPDKEDEIGAEPVGLPAPQLPPGQIPA